VFQAHFIKRFKSISSWHIEEHFKLILSNVSSIFLLVEYHWSRLTSDSDLLHSKFCSFHVIEADSLLSDELSQWDQSLSSDSCLLHACNRACFVRWSTQSRNQLLSSNLCLQRITELVLIASIAFNKACSIHVYYMHVTKLVFWWRAQSKDQLLTCHYSRLTLSNELYNEINRYLIL